MASLRRSLPPALGAKLDHAAERLPPTVVKFRRGHYRVVLEHGGPQVLNAFVNSQHGGRPVRQRRLQCSRVGPEVGVIQRPFGIEAYAVADQAGEAAEQRTAFVIGVAPFVVQSRVLVQHPRADRLAFALLGAQIVERRCQRDADADAFLPLVKDADEFRMGQHLVRWPVRGRHERALRNLFSRGLGGLVGDLGQFLSPSRCLAERTFDIRRRLHHPPLSIMGSVAIMGDVGSKTL